MEGGKTGCGGVTHGIQVLPARTQGHRRRAALKAAERPSSRRCGRPPAPAVLALIVLQPSADNIVTRHDMMAGDAGT